MDSKSNNKPMPVSTQQLLMGLLLLAWLAIDAVTAFALSRAGTDKAQLILNAIVMYGLIFGQLDAIAGWTLFGTSHWLIRVGLLVLGFITLNATGSLVTYANPASIWLTLSTVHLATIFLGLLPMRALGFRCYMTSDENTDQVGSGKMAWQFSIREIMIATAFVALALGVLRGMKWSFDWNDLIQTILIYVCLTAMTLINWSAGFLKQPWLAAFVPLGVALVLGLAAGAVEGMALAWIAFTSLQTLVMLLSIAAIRVAGYRFGKE